AVDRGPSRSARRTGVRAGRGIVGLRRGPCQAVAGVDAENRIGVVLPPRPGAATPRRAVSRQRPVPVQGHLRGPLPPRGGLLGRTEHVLENRYPRLALVEQELLHLPVGRAVQ